MPDIREFKEREQLVAEFQEWLPMVEEMLVNGSRQQRKEYACYLAERADAFRVYAYEAAGGNADGLPYRDPKLWKVLEQSEDIGYVMLVWFQSVMYEYWSRVLRRDPVLTLEKFGFSEE
jgi:hypothetical protein